MASQGAPTIDENAALQLLLALQQQVVDLQTQQGVVAARLAQQQQQQHQPHQPHQPAAARPAQPRLASPPAYDGKSADLDEWFSVLDQQFEWYGMTLDEERIKFAAVHFRGSARDWWQNLTAAHRAQHSWGTLQTALRHRFQPVTTAELARAKLIGLAQGRHSVHEYVASYRRLMISLPAMEEGDRLFAFLRGLKPTIAAQLRVRSVATVDDAIEMAVRVGSLSDYAILAAGTGGIGSPQQGSTPMELDALLSDPADEPDSAPADGGGPVTRAELIAALNAIAQQRIPSRYQGGVSGQGAPRQRGSAGRGLPRIPHLSPDQVKEYMDAGKCFGCGSTAHQSRACPKRKEGPDGRPSWGN
jgi:hypothetical protein